MKLNSLHIKNFRLIEDLQIPELGRVNLIVGKNNSGKSTVLEALRIYAHVAYPRLLSLISMEHDENVSLRASDVDNTSSLDELPLAHFFTGRSLDPARSINMGEVGAINAGLQISFLRNAPRSEPIIRPDGTPDLHQFSPRDYLQIISRKRSFALDLTAVSDLSQLRDFGRLSHWFAESQIPCSHIPTQLPDLTALAKVWDSIALTDSQSVVLQSLQSVEPDVENLIFVEKDAGDTDEDPREARSRRARPRTAKVKLKGIPRPVPLQSLGDGMLRVLQLALKAFPAKGGFFLIDEVENGLHYSVQERIWRQLFALAEDLDMQIFATTHSWDCIESFAKIAAEKSDTKSVLFRMGRSIRKSDHGKIIATSFTGEELTAITQADVEVR